MTRTVDLNADVGEGEGDDAALMLFLSSASIACGYHAGNAAVMRNAVEFARRHNVSIGAHPGFRDRKGFGRRELQLSTTELHELVVRQLELLADVAAEKRIRLKHAKPHGALYNMAARDSSIAGAVAGAVASFDASLVLFGLAGSRLIEAGRQAGLRTASEVFADRAYRSDGSLVPRTDAGAVLSDPAVVVQRGVDMVRDRAVTAVDGTQVTLDVDTICVHGDTPGSIELARSLRKALEAAGFTIAAPAP